MKCCCVILRWDQSKDFEYTPFPADILKFEQGICTECHWVYYRSQTCKTKGQSARDIGPTCNKMGHEYYMNRGDKFETNM